jgi:uncharacterized protein YpmB
MNWKKYLPEHIIIIIIIIIIDVCVAMFYLYNN